MRAAEKPSRHESSSGRVDSAPYSKQVDGLIDSKVIEGSRRRRRAKETIATVRYVKSCSSPSASFL